ncbi:hypothetical protein [Salana multivorans]
MPETLRMDTAMLAAYVPYDAGYQPGPDQVALMGLRGRRVIGVAVCGWDPTDGRERAYAARLAIQVDAAMQQAGADGYLVLGYGPDGGDRALRLTETLTQALGRQVRDTLHIEGEAVAVWDPRHDWGPPHPLPDFTDQARRLGLDAPAASREEALGRFKPLAQPTYQRLGVEESEALTRMRPTERFTRVCRIIDADHAEGSTTPQDRAFVAAATSSSMVVRDATIAWAAQTRERTDFLVDSYRGAPEADRPAAASLAAASLMLGTGHSLSVGEILPHADITGPHAQLTRLVTTAHSLGASPEQLRRDLDSAAPAALARADAVFLGADSNPVSMPLPPRQADLDLGH